MQSVAIHIYIAILASQKTGALVEKNTPDLQLQNLASQMRSEQGANLICESSYDYESAPSLMEARAIIK